MSDVVTLLQTRSVYVLVVVLLGVGLYGMFARPNLIHKVIGLTVFQVAIFLFFIEGSVRDGASAPVIDPVLGSDPGAYVNPLPHLLILTAIVVGAGTLGVALSLVLRLYADHQTLEEDELIERLSGASGRAGPPDPDTEEDVQEGGEP